MFTPAQSLRKFIAMKTLCWCESLINSIANLSQPSKLPLPVYDSLMGGLNTEAPLYFYRYRKCVLSRVS